MPEQPWEQYLTSQDRDVLKASGLGARMGFGARPAMLIVDVNYNFLGREPLPILEAIKKWRNCCGPAGWDALPRIGRLSDTCRKQRIPVIYATYTRRKDGFDAGSWRWKNAREFENTEEEILGNEIVAAIRPADQDIVITKTKPSAFFGTPLLSFLVDLSVDTLLICGVSTSGCVRATVVDAFSNNIRCAVLSDACWDRLELSHAVGLLDMGAKYADVITTDEAVSYIGSRPSSLYPVLFGRTEAGDATEPAD